MDDRLPEKVQVGLAIVAVAAGLTLVGMYAWKAVKAAVDMFAESSAEQTIDARAHTGVDQPEAGQQAGDTDPGFVVINSVQRSDVAVYRDNKTGCEWVGRRGEGLTPRLAAPDAQGISRQICQGGVS